MGTSADKQTSNNNKRKNIKMYPNSIINSGPNPERGEPTGTPQGMYPEEGFEGMETAIADGRKVDDTERQRQISEGLKAEGLGAPDPNSSNFGLTVEKVLPPPEDSTPTTESLGQTAVDGAGESLNPER